MDPSAIWNFDSPGGRLFGRGTSAAGITCNTRNEGGGAAGTAAPPAELERINQDRLYDLTGYRYGWTNRDHGDEKETADELYRPYSDIAWNDEGDGTVQLKPWGEVAR